MIKSFITKTRWLVTIILLTTLGVSQMWGTVTSTYTFSTADNGKTITNNSVQWGLGASSVATNGTSLYLGGTITITMPTGAYLYSAKINKSSNWAAATKVTVLLKSGSTTLRTFSASNYSSAFTLTSNQTDGSYTIEQGLTTNKAWITSIQLVYYPQTVVTLDKNGGDDDGQAKCTYNATSCSSFTAATRAGYTCTGYYTATSAGTKVLNADGSKASTSVSGWWSSSKWCKDAASATLYAQWESAASCDADPTIGAASLNGSFNSGGVTSLTNTISFSTTSCDPNTNCAWIDYGFVWGTSASPTVSNTKMQKGISGEATSWDMTSPSTFTVDNTYKVRAYGKNGKTGAEFVYSASDLSFTPRSVAFNSNGGSAVATKYIKSGGTITSPGAPATPKTGYTFDSWRTDAGLGTEVNFSNAVNASTTYYAKWNAKQCTVTFDKEGGSGGSNNATATYDAAMPDITPPTKTDFIFGGYWDGDDGTGNQYYKADGTSNANWNKNTTSNTSLYAKWTEHTYTNYRTLCSCPNYSFHSKNSSSVWEDPICFAQVGSSTLYRTEEIELPTDGVSFKVGWHDADDVANAKTNEKDWQYMVAGPTTTRLGGGYWTVGGHLTSGNAGGAKGYFYVYSDSNEDNKYVGFTPSGYVLRWGKGESWTSKAFTAASASIDETEWNTEVVTLSSSNASDHIYVGLKTESGYVWCNNSEEQRVIFCSPGVWTTDGCKIALWDKTHLAWRGFMQDADGDGVYEGTVPSTCTEVTFARFDGAKTEPVWDQQYDKSADQTISSLTDKNMFSVTGWGSSHVCAGNWETVYSKPGVFRINAGSNLKNWSCKFVPHFVLTYDKNSNDATGATDPTTVASDAGSKNVSVAACEFTAPTGYHFDHWDTAPDGSGSDYAPNATYNLTADATLYAIWAPNNHTLTWELDGGSISSAGTAAGTVAYGTALTAPTVTKTGYTFNTWSPAVPSTMPDNDVTCTATWTPITYSVRFNRNGGTGGSDMSNQNFTYDVAQNLSTCTFTHATKSFGGWTTNSDGTGDEYANGANVSNLSSTQGAVVDLYAKWVDCDLYTVTLNVNGSAWKTWTQGSCGAAIDLSGYQDVPSCGGGYTLVGWSTTNSGISTTAPTITKTSSYTPEANTTLYAVYSYSAKIGTKVMNLTGFGGSTKPYILVANNSNVAMKTADDTVHVAKSATGDALIVTSSNNPKELYFSDAGSSKWFIYSPYKKGSNEYFDYEYYYAPSGSGGQLSTYDDADYDEWYIDLYDEYTGEDDIKSCYYGDCYYDYDEIESFMKANDFTNELWSVSVNSTTGVATITAVDAGSNTRTWYYKSQKTFKTYSGSTQSAVALYEYNPSGTAYTTQPSMTVYSITKGAETNGTYTISAGVVCSGGSVSLTATPDPGYTFSGWTSSNGGSFSPNASTATATYTIGSANTTLTANFVAATPHDITWMVNGSAYTTGEPTSSLTGGTSFSTMTLPTAPANNTLSSACSAVANQFVGWSQTDMGFVTGQSAPTLFTDAAGAGSAYGVMGGEDVTFYAVFAQDGSSNYMSRCPHTYTITLDDNGDYGGNGSATATEKGTSLTINSTPTRLGYSVEGYYKEVGTTTKVATDAGALQNGSGSGIDGWTNSSSQFIGTSDGTLYTKWNIVTYNLTYENLNGATNSNPATYQVTTATIVLAAPGSRTGYTFAGWTCGGDAITQIALGSTGDKTITANWTANKYNITYKDKDDAAYSGDKTDGRPTGLPAQHTYGSATELNDGTRTGYRFDGWYTSSNCSTGKVTSLGATDYTSAITLYAKWTASHTYSFSKNGVVDGTLQKGAVEGETVTMPNTTVDCGLWTTFEGWVESDVAETTTEPTMYKAGDVYVVPVGSGDKTFKAVYSKHEGDGTVSYEKVTSGHKSGTYIMVSSNDLVYTGQHSGSGTTDYGDNTSVIQSAGVVTAANLPNTAKEVTVRIGKGGSINNTFAIQIPSAKYLSATNGNYLNSDITDVKSAYVWKFDNGTDSYGKSGSEKTGSAGAIRSTTQTTRVIQPNGDRFACYEHTYTNYVYLYRKKVAGTTYYTTAPASCAVPTQITVSYNDNKSHAGDQTITGMPSGTTLDFTSYPNFDSYTIGAAPTDPTGYHFAGWNTQADGNGDDYTAGSSVTTFGYRETITLYAKWERVYTVTLYDNGSLRTTLTQASAGATVALPDGNNCTPSSEFSFVGWTESAVELNADPVRPASATLHATGAWEPESDITLYSVYSRSVAGCEDFATGVSGAYKLYNKATNDYAIVTANANRYDKANSGTAEIFYIAYSTAKSAYTIRTSLGYLGWSGGSGSETLSKDNTTPYYWEITEGSSGNAGYWNFQPIGASTKQFSGNGTYFNFGSNSTKYYIRLEKNAMTYYYNTAICEGSQITFHDGGGTISGTPTTPTGASWNSGTHVLSGLEDCDKITTFPTASYDGWTFVGWSTEDYTNCGKHTAGTSQYAEENASTEEPDASNIYKTDGNPYVVRGGSIDLYPIFTRFPDNEPFDIESGGRYYMYYLDPDVDDGFGAPARRYAGAWDGTKRYTATTSCAEATEFEFTKSGDVWHIQNVDNDKWLGGKSNDDWLIENNSLGTLTDWTITIRSGNQFNATCQSGRQIIVYDNFFMDYSSNNLVNNLGYYCVYLGSCEERIFSSEPHPTSTIDLTGDPYVTSSNGQTVRATATMTLSASHLSSVPANKIIVSGGSGLKFATTASANPTNTVSLSLTEGRLAATTIYVYYTPTATEDGLENIIVTAKAYNGSSPKDLQTTGTVHCRHLPADFVIAAKWNNKWYALPSTCNSSGTSTTGVLITVDNDNDPTAATYAPSTTKWGLRQTKAGSRVDGSHNDRMVFTERITTATANNQQALYNYNGADVYTNATYTNYNNTNPERYEWIPVSSDFKDYTLTNAEANKPLILRNSDGEFKAQTTDQAYDGKVRLLPATFYEDNVQIIEWKTNSVVIMYTGTETTAIAKAGDNSETSAQTLSSQKLTHGIYEVTTGTALTGKTGENLILTFGSSAGKKIFEIPWIINGSANATSGHEKQDVVILNNGKLTAQSTKYSFRNIYVYSGGKLKIASGTSLGVNNIILRAGRISTNGTGGSATYNYDYPQVELGGTLTSTKTDIKYEYITDYDHWYHLCLPFDATLNSIHYPTEYYGQNVKEDNKGSWIIKRYDGATRATGNYAAWVDIESESATVASAGHGYIFWGAPKKISVGGAAKVRQQWGIQRMTMSVAAATATAAETANKTVDGLGSYASVPGNSGKVNDQGWNLIGNPYLMNLSGLNSTSLKTGKLIEEVIGGNKTGHWVSNNDGVRYVTVPDNHFDNYTAQTMAWFTSSNPMVAGRAFFVQIDGDATGVQFNTADRKSLMPALFAKVEESVDIETGIVMSDETKKDEVNFWIKDGKTEAYESNADYPKTPNGSNFNIYGVHEACDLSWIAISPEIAEGSMAIGYQVPTAGEYMLSLSETYVSDKIDHVLVTDHEVSPEITTDLMEGSYEFMVNQAETNKTRFTVSIVLKDEAQTPTDIDDVREDPDKPTKFIYHDKIYILRGGQIYDATGKQVKGGLK